MLVFFNTKCCHLFELAFHDYLKGFLVIRLPLPLRNIVHNRVHHLLVVSRKLKQPVLLLNDLLGVVSCLHFQASLFVARLRPAHPEVLSPLPRLDHFLLTLAFEVDKLLRVKGLSGLWLGLHPALTPLFLHKHQGWTGGLVLAFEVRRVIGGCALLFGLGFGGWNAC